MANMSRVGKERNQKRGKFFLRLLQNLRSQLTWREVLVGFLASILLAAILVGLRNGVVPEFEMDQSANQDVRASKDVQYIDEEATDLKRSEARASVPSVYDRDQSRISELKKSIRSIFQDARTLLDEYEVTPKGSISPEKEQILISELKNLDEETLTDEILPLLLSVRFHTDVENRILKILDTVLRDISEAREYLRQFDLQLPESSEKEKDTLIQYMESLLVPTFVFNAKETETRKDRAASQVPVIEVQIKRGQTVVRYGERITPNLLRQLSALRNLLEPSSLILRGLGFFLFSVILLYALWRYLVFFKPRNIVIRKHATLVLVIVSAELLIIRLATALADILDDRFQWFQDPTILYYAIPFALGPLLVSLLIDGNLGVMVSVILATLIGLFYGDIYIAVYLIMGSLAGIYSIKQYKDRAAIIKAGFAIGILNCICFAGLHILRQDPVTLPASLELLALAFISGILASTVASILLPSLEYFFKIVTDIRFLELSNLNDPILRRLSVEAPGTYHHSLMVATLSENAAEAIRANPLLTRVSAYYHDIGKILKPEYFVENQSLDYNKHEQISPRMSSLVLSSHIKDGLQLAKEIGLPQQIREMIPQHHGTRMMTYFFQKAKDSVNRRNSTVSDTDFRYSGPKPQSKEAAIMMMADSVEAASRTLSNPNPSQIIGMIDRLVDGIVSDGQFDECDITLKDIRLVKESFFKIITGIFHRRIDYPNYDFNQNGTKAGGTAIQDPDTEQTKTI